MFPYFCTWVDSRLISILFLSINSFYNNLFFISYTLYIILSIDINYKFKINDFFNEDQMEDH